MKYDAFISYRHLEKDMFVAKGIHKALETTKIPGKIKKLTGKKRIQRVFRDQEELPIGSDLGENIEAALRESEYLVVICSPETKDSVWVMKEIDTFIALHGREKILAVLVEGEPEDSFPHQILVDDYGNPVEPLAADVRGTDKKEIAAKIKSESLRLAAAVIGCDYDDLRQRHREMKMRRYVAIAAVFAVFGVAFGLYNAYSRAKINENYQQKLINESRVLAKTSAAVLEDGDRKTAALIAVEGLPHDGVERPFVADAMYSLSNALGCYRVSSSYSIDKKLVHDRDVRDFAASTDGTRCIAYDSNQSLYYWDVATGELIFKILPQYTDEGKDKIEAVAVCGDKVMVVSTYFLSCYDEKGNELYRKQVPYVSGAAFTKDSTRVAIMSNFELAVYDCESGEKVSEYYQADGLGLSSDIRINDAGDTVLFHTFDGSLVGYFDVNDSKCWALEKEREDFLGAEFTVDSAIVIVRGTGEKVDGDDLTQIQVEKYDIKTGEVLFDKKYSVDQYDPLVDEAECGSRIYSSNGVEHKELLVRCKTTCLLLDLDSGSILGKHNSKVTIYEMLYHERSETVYLLASGGSVLLLDFSTGEAQETTLTTDIGLDRFFTSENYLIYNTVGDSELVVKSVLTDSDAVFIDETKNWDYCEDAVASPLEKTYIVAGRSLNGDDFYYRVYDSSDDKMIDAFMINDKKIDDIFYLDEDTVVIPSLGDGVTLYYYSISDKKYEKVDVSDDYISEFNISSDKKFMAMYLSSYLLVYDLENRKITAEGDLFDGYSTSITYVAISKDGKTVYFTVNNEKAYYLEIETRVMDQILTDYRMDKLELSDDESMLITVCSDGMLRLFSLPDQSLIEEIEFIGDEGSITYLSADKKRLYLIGSDYLLRIYDLEKHDYIYESADKYVGIEVDFDEDNNILIINSYGRLSIFDLNSYGFLGTADTGRLYLGQQDCIISFSKNKMYKHKLKTLDDLLKQVKEQFGDAELTPSQKRKYNIG
jgi:WD40 repeat protein